MKHSPGTWHGVRAVTPDNVSDGQMAINWLTDLYARLDPDSVLSRLGPDAMRPGHIGTRTRVSPVLLRYVVYGDDWASPKATLDNIRKRIRDPKDSLDADYVLDGLRNYGASEDYLNRARVALTFDSVDEYYAKFEGLGVRKEEALAIRKKDEYDARQTGIPLHEYLGRGWAGSPLSIDQFGNLTGETLWQKAILAAEGRGLTVVARNDPLLDEVTLAGERILPSVDTAAMDRVAVGDMPIGALGGGEKKLRKWGLARARVNAEPETYLPPADVIREATVDGEVRYEMGRVTASGMAHSIAATLTPAEVQEALDWYLDMRRVILAFNDNDPDKAAQWIVGYGLTQLQATPEDGWQSFLRLREAIQTGESLPVLDKKAMQRLGGLNAEAVTRVLQGAMTFEGSGPKLLDFIDALLGKTTRTNGLPGLPVAGDIWMKRARGWVDSTTANRLARIYGHRQSGMVTHRLGLAPMPAGEAKLQDGYVRVYHYTGTVEDLDSIRARGLDLKYAKGDTYGEPNAIWVSTRIPEGDRNYVEVHVPLRDFDIGRPAWMAEDGTHSMTKAEVQDYIDHMHGARGSYTLNVKKVGAKRIVTWQEEWMPTYRYLVRDGPTDPDAFLEQFRFFIEQGDPHNKHIQIAAQRRLAELRGETKGTVVVKSGRSTFSTEVGPEVGVGDALSDKGDGEYLRVPREYVSEGNPTDEQYADISDWVEEVTAELNKGNKLGQLNEVQVQALIWTYLRKVHGENGGDPTNVFFSRNINATTELKPGAGSRHADVFPWFEPDDPDTALLSPEVTRELTDRVIPEFSALAEEFTGVHAIHHTPGEGAWFGGLNPNVTSELAPSTPEAAEAYIASLGYLTQQSMTLASRLGRDIPVGEVVDEANFPSIANGSSWAVDVVGDTGMTLEQARTLHRALVEAGVTPISDASGIIPLDNGEWVIRAQYLPWDDDAGKFVEGVITQDQFTEWATDEQLTAIGRVATENGIELYDGAARRRLVTFVKSENDWATQPNGEGHLGVVRRLLGEAKANELGSSYAARAAAIIEGAHQDLVPAETAAFRARQAVRRGHTLDPDVPDGDFTVGPARAGEPPAGAAPAGEPGPAPRAAGGNPGGSGGGRTAGPGDVETQYQKAPTGTRAAIVRLHNEQVSQMYLSRPLLRRDSTLHELVHHWAWERLDPSAIRRIKGLYAGRPGSAPGGRVSRAKRLTADEQEWFVDQFLGYVRTGTAPANGLVPFFEFYKAHLKGMRGHAKSVDPNVSAVIDEMLQKRPYRGYGYDVDEVSAMQWMMAGDQRARRHARDLIHFKGERTWLERSINHPFFGMYPASYMWGKVLPEMAEFLLFRPFGLKTPLLGLQTVNTLYRSFMTQQEYDPELRQFLLDNEPALRALSMMTPGLPWELPANVPLLFRRWAENAQENAVRQAEGKEPVDFAWDKAILDIASYQIGPVRSVISLPQTIQGALVTSDVMKQVATGELETKAERTIREENEALRLEQQGELDPAEQLSVTINDAVKTLTGGLMNIQPEDRP